MNRDADSLSSFNKRDRLGARRPSGLTIQLSGACCSVDTVAGVLGVAARLFGRPEGRLTGELSTASRTGSNLEGMKEMNMRTETVQSRSRKQTSLRNVETSQRLNCQRYSQDPVIESEFPRVRVVT